MLTCTGGLLKSPFKFTMRALMEATGDTLADTGVAEATPAPQPTSAAKPRKPLSPNAVTAAFVIPSVAAHLIVGITLHLTPQPVLAATNERAENEFFEVAPLPTPEPEPEVAPEPEPEPEPVRTRRRVIAPERETPPALPDPEPLAPTEEPDPTPAVPRETVRLEAPGGQPTGLAAGAGSSGAAGSARGGRPADVARGEASGGGGGLDVAALRREYTRSVLRAARGAAGGLRRIAQRVGDSSDLGATRIRLTISPSGRLVSAQIAQSCGNPRLDQAALNALQGVTYPPPHAALGQVSRTIPIPWSRIAR